MNKFQADVWLEMWFIIFSVDIINKISDANWIMYVCCTVAMI